MTDFELELGSIVARTRAGKELDTAAALVLGMSLVGARHEGSPEVWAEEEVARVDAAVGVAGMPKSEGIASLVDRK